MGRLLALLGGLLLSALAIAQVTPAVTLTATPATANVTATPTLTWSTAPAASGCMASGAWTGAKAASGSQLGATITATSTYNLECSWPGDLRAVLTWRPPTTRTDGSALTNLAGTRIYYGLTPTALAQLADVAGATLTTYTIEPLDPNVWYFALTAYDAANIESVRTPTVSKTTRAPTVVRASATVTITPAPSPPTELRVVSLSVPVSGAAMTVDPVPAFGINKAGARTATVFGFVRSGTPCIDAPEPAFSYRGQDYYRIARANVGWWATTPRDNVAAPCRPSVG